LKLFGKKKSQDVITVVSGLPRSGTSMMMSMLEAGGILSVTDNERTADDDNPKGYYELERVKKLPDGDVAWLADAPGKAVKVISGLIRYLPADRRYRIIVMHRRMEEILKSQKQMLVNRGETTDDDDAEIGAVMAKHLEGVEAWIKTQANMELIIVNYNEVLKDPAGQVAVVNKFLGGKLDTAKMMAVVDRQLHRQRA
jgi:hypothetical protein